MSFWYKVMNHPREMFASEVAWRKKILDPQGPFLQKWNKIFLLSCLIAVSLDPLFFYVPVIEDGKKCLSLDSTMEITARVLRSLTDIFYMLHIIFQFRTGFIAPSSRVCGRGVLVEDTWAIAKRYLSSYFLIDILSVLPLPQVVILIITPKMAGSSYLNTKNMLKFVVIFQYVPRFIRIYPLYREVATSRILRETAWAGAAFNLFLYMIASHVIGAFWYLFSIERQTNCWRQACGTQDTCRRAYLFCDGAGGAGNLSFLDNHCPIRTPNETVFNFGIFLDALQSGVALSSTGFSDKFFYCFWWGMRNLRDLSMVSEPGFMRTNKERIEQLESGLGAVQDRLQRMEIGMNDKLHHMEEVLNRLTNKLLGLNIAKALSSCSASTGDIISTTERLKEELEITSQRQDVVSSFLRDYQLSNQEINALRDEDLNDNFFKALSHVQQIHANCKVLLRTHHQRAGLELMDMMAVYQEGAYERLCRWVQAECRKLGDNDNPEVDELLKTTIHWLKERPALFKYCAEEVANMRHNALFRRFISALTRGGPGGMPRPIEVHAHDPLRYVGDMLGWLHQALASERELVHAQLDPDAVVDTGSTVNRFSKSLENGTGKTESDLTFVLDRIFEGVCRPFKVRVEQVLQSQPSLIIACKLSNLAILDFRWTKQGTQLIEECLVHWRHLSVDEATWEPKQQLQTIFPQLNLEDKVPLVGGGIDRPPECPNQIPNTESEIVGKM